MLLCIAITKDGHLQILYLLDPESCTLVISHKLAVIVRTVNYKVAYVLGMLHLLCSVQTPIYDT